MANRNASGRVGGAFASFVLVFLVVPPAVIVLPFVLLLGAIVGALWGVAGWGLRRVLRPSFSVGGAVALAIAIIVVAVTPLGEARVSSAVPWPAPDVRPSIQMRGMDGTYWVEVETPNGRIAQALWTDWGPAGRANLYRTPRGALVVIGGGSITAIIALPASDPPKWGGAEELIDGDEWAYVGAVASIGGRDLRFFPPSELTECIPLYGEGRVPVRREFQSVHGFDCNPRHPR